MPFFVGWGNLKLKYCGEQVKEMEGMEDLCIVTFPDGTHDISHQLNIV